MKITFVCIVTLSLWLVQADESTGVYEHETREAVVMLPTAEKADHSEDPVAAALMKAREAKDPLFDFLQNLVAHPKKALETPHHGNLASSVWKTLGGTHSKPPQLEKGHLLRLPTRSHHHHMQHKDGRKKATKKKHLAPVEVLAEEGVEEGASLNRRNWRRQENRFVYGDHGGGGGHNGLYDQWMRRHMHKHGWLYGDNKYAEAAHAYHKAGAYAIQRRSRLEKKWLSKAKSEWIAAQQRYTHATTPRSRRSRAFQRAHAAAKRRAEHTWRTTNGGHLHSTLFRKSKKQAPKKSPKKVIKKATKIKFPHLPPGYALHTKCAWANGGTRWNYALRSVGECAELCKNEPGGEAEFMTWKPKAKVCKCSSQEEMANKGLGRYAKKPFAKCEGNVWKRHKVKVAKVKVVKTKALKAKAIVLDMPSADVAPTSMETSMEDVSPIGGPGIFSRLAKALNSKKPKKPAHVTMPLADYPKIVATKPEEGPILRGFDKKEPGAGYRLFKKCAWANGGTQWNYSLLTEMECAAVCHDDPKGNTQYMTWKPATKVCKCSNQADMDQEGTGAYTAKPFKKCEGNVWKYEIPIGKTPN